MSIASQPIIELSQPLNHEQSKIEPKKTKKSKKILVKKGQWSSQEDKLLEQWVKTNGPKNWEACGRFIQGRKGKQCREHWNNCLNPELKKGNWGPEEDFLIMFFYEKCKGSWKKIIPLFDGRIENSIKNRFYSQLRKHATKNMEAKERKRMIAKIKLNELKKYLNEALTETRNVLLKKTQMTPEQFELFLQKNEQKIKESISSNDSDLESNESNEAEANLSTNLGGTFGEEDSVKNSFIHKRKRTEDDSNSKDTGINKSLEWENLEIFPKEKENSEDLFEIKEIELDEDKSDNFYNFTSSKDNGINKSLEEENLEFFPKEKENSEGLFEIKEIELDEDKSDNFYNFTSSKDNGMICNEMPLNDLENNINIDELSFDNFELSKNNYLKNIYEEYDSKNKFEIDNFVNIFEKKNFEDAFNINFIKEE